MQISLLSFRWTVGNLAVRVYRVVRNSKPLPNSMNKSYLNLPRKLDFESTLSVKEALHSSNINSYYCHTRDLIRHVVSDCAPSCDMGKISISDKISI